MHIGILGIGGIGGFLAATLSKENNVTCVTNKETLDFIKNGKLKFISQSFSAFSADSIISLPKRPGAHSGLPATLRRCLYSGFHPAPEHSHDRQFAMPVWHFVQPSISQCRSAPHQ